MAVSASCPKCSATAVVPEKLIGQKVRCKTCESVFVVEAAVPAPVPELAAASPAPAELPVVEMSSHHDAGGEQLPVARMSAEEETEVEEMPVARIDEAPAEKPPAAPSAPQPAKSDSGPGNKNGDKNGILAPAEQPDEIGRLGNFRVLKILGQGSMGIVYQAEDPLKRPIALKVLLPALAANAKAKDRFCRKARATAAIQHDHIVPISAIGEERGVAFLAMPLLKGRTLEDYLKTHALSPKEATRITKEIAEALAAAHDQKLIHRDLKPSNIWLEGERRRVRLLDFGLARIVSDGPGEADHGELAYKAPEQVRGEKVDGRADLFSLGCVLYQMLTDTRPFDGDDNAAIRASLASHTPTPPREINGGVPEAVSDLAMKLLAKSPADRCQSPAEVLEAIRSLEGDLPSASSSLANSIQKLVTQETKAPKGSSKGAAREASKEGARDGAKDGAKDAFKDMSKDVFKDASKDAPKGSQKGSTARPGSKPPAGGKSSASKAAAPKSSPAPADADHPPAKKSGIGLWIAVVVGILVLGAGGGLAAWFATHGDATAPVKTAKVSPKQASKDVPKDGSKEVAKETPRGKDGEKKKDPVDVEKNPPPKVKKTPVDKNLEPVTLAALELSMPVELKDFAAIKDVYTLAEQPQKIGLHTVEGKTHFFELYDLKKQSREAKVKLEDNVDLIDVDPTGQTLVTSNAEKRFTLYTLPMGGVITEDWAPYDTPKDANRFLRGGKIAQVAMLSKHLLLAVTTEGHGDGWVIPGNKLEYMIPRPERRDYRKEAVEANIDFVLSPDRRLLAYANDEGIEFRDARNGNVIGKTPKLIKYGDGGKPEMVGMGFDPTGKRLAAYFTVPKAGARTYFHAHFSVPDGKEMFLEPGSDPVDRTIEFVNGEFFLGIDRRHATLRNDKGKALASCSFPGKGGLFAPKLLGPKVVYAFLGERDAPAVGIVSVPLKAPPPKIEPKVDPKKDPDKDKSLGDLFAPKTDPTPDPKTPGAVETQEIWEFSRQGIVRKGIRTLQ